MNYEAAVAQEQAGRAGETLAELNESLGPELSVIIPTFNEVSNIRPLLQRLTASLAGVRWEVIFVDDSSPDGTADSVRILAQRDRRVRCLQRFGRRGLSSACIEGVLSSAAPWVAVMDADLQHDERLLPRMLHVLESENVDIVIGSRYIDGGTTGEWTRGRAAISRLSTSLSKVIISQDLKDPMSGFFMMRRQVLQEALPRLSSIGFKILVDLFASVGRPLRFRELPFEFRPRVHGESKLDSLVAWEYLMLILDKGLGHLIPVRFLSFSIVGGIGLGVHMSTLWILFALSPLPFAIGQSIATAVAMTSNFMLNNVLTYRDTRLKGWKIVKGWASFCVACSLGAVSNVSVASFLYQQNHEGWAVAAFGGILIGTVWNYVVTSTYTWKK